MKLYLDVWKNFTNFNGRASRKEYWTFTICHLLILISTCAFIYSSYLLPGEYAIITVLSQFGYIFLLLYWIISLVPRIALTVRRLHDINVTGWFAILMAFSTVGEVALMILALMPSKLENNNFAPRPSHGDD